MTMFKTAYSSVIGALAATAAPLVVGSARIRAGVLGLLQACARGFQELHKDGKINALHPPGEW